MKGMFGRMAVTVAVGVALATAVAGPASAATDTIGVTETNGVVSVPASTNVTLGDTVRVANNSTGNQAFGLFAGGACGANNAQNFGLVMPGQAVTLGTFSTPTYTNGQTVTFSINSLLNVCTPFSIVLTSAPPPDVPEASVVVGLLGAALALFGGGFFFVRRRRARVA
jgi:hypothetical protein